MVCLHRDRLDHRAACDERRHRIEQLAPAVQHANTVGAQHLVTGERAEVDVERMEVDGLMRHRLAGVQQRQRTDGLGARDQLGHRGHRTGDVRMVAERNHFHALVELQRVQVDAAVVGDAVPLQGGTGAAGQLLPRDQVRVVFQFGGDDDVAGADGVVEPVVAQHIRDQVDRLGGVLGEHQLVGLGADEGRDVGAALFVGVGGLLHQLVRTAMHRAVGRGQKVTFGVEHLHGPLRRRTGIQVRQLISAAHHPLQDREVRPDFVEIHCQIRRRADAVMSGSDRLGEALVSVGVELVGQLGPTGLDDAAADEHVDELRLDVAQDAGVVRDQQQTRRAPPRRSGSPLR